MRHKADNLPFVLIVAALLLTSCQTVELLTSSDAVSTALPQLTPCQPVACWQGGSLNAVRPGNVQDYARQMPGFESAQLSNTWASGDLSAYAWMDGAGHSIRVAFRDDKGIAAYQMVDSVELGQVIARFGTPSSVFVWSNAAQGRYTADIIVVFAAQGLLVFSGEEKVHQDVVTLSPRTKFIGYSLATSNELKEIIQALSLASSSPPNQQDPGLDKYVTKAQEWHSYGDYRVDVRN
jgi:hypothetical protein